MISVHFQGKPFSITVIQVYASTTNAKKAEVEQFNEELEDFLELKPKTMSSLPGSSPGGSRKFEGGRRQRGSGNNCLIKC